MESKFEIRTDLALESREELQLSDRELKGIQMEEKQIPHLGIHVVKMVITNKSGEKILQRPQGTYLTLEVPQMSVEDEEYHREISCVLSEYISELIHPFWVNEEISILVVGLGNREVTPDALGPHVVDNLMITRRDEKKHIVINGIIPGVMAQTGMETATIIKGVVAESKPDVVICIDALAARNSNRLNTTIQLSNAGIHPGSGIGNHRMAITKESIGTNVVAIGVPTVIDTPTIVYDTLENLLKELSTAKHFSSVADTFRQWNKQEKYQFIRELIDPQMANMFVTPKDTDETIKRIGYTISEAINMMSDSEQGMDKM